MRRLVGNRKGDLTENALSLIVAVLGLALLFFAAWKIYDYMAGAEARDAKKTIEFIESRAEEIKVGETSKVVIKGIKGWFFSGWAADDPSRPDKCLLNTSLLTCNSSLITVSYKLS